MSNRVKRFRPTKTQSAAAALALSLFVFPVQGSSEPNAATRETEYASQESFSSEFGSKFASGYFQSESGKCAVTLLVTEKQDPEFPASTTAARVRLKLHPGEVAGVDSEEGQSLNLTCGMNATALMVDKGERNALNAAGKKTPPSGSSAGLDWSIYHQW
jgi:hypothetical protein